MLNKAVHQLEGLPVEQQGT